MLRRHPDAVLTAHLMDHSRKELYVEGTRDRLFLTWLLGQRLNPNALIREIACVELPEQPGGERGRVIHFAELLGGVDVRIRMFADADWDRVLGRSVPGRVWLTDKRDLEGYILRVECLDKVLSLGLSTEKITAIEILKAVRQHGRRLGAARLMSELESLDLPFQKTDVTKYLAVDAAGMSLDLHGFLRALLQNAGVSLVRLRELQNRIDSVEASHAKVPDAQMIHGKDAVAVIAVALSKFGLDQKEIARLLWTSFECAFVESGSVLETVVTFLHEP
jgi:hypothetical protein